MIDRFKGRGVVVTGGASGIGRAVAARMAAEGARVSIWDINEAAALSVARAIGAEARRLDVGDWRAVQTAAAETVELFGGIDVLVCSAGVIGPSAAVADLAPEAFEAVFQVNVFGVFNCAKALLPAMVEGGYGRIVTLSALAGREGGARQAALSSSKAAVIGLTKALAKEVATRNITVNSVAPSAVLTPALDHFSGAHVDYLKSRIPMGRLGSVDEIAALVCWIASEECAFTTGACFDASGGRAAD